MRLRFVLPAALVAAGAYMASREQRPVDATAPSADAEPDMTAANWAEAPAPVVAGLDEIAVAAAQASAGRSDLAWPAPVTAPPAPAQAPVWHDDADWTAFGADDAPAPAPAAPPVEAAAHDNAHPVAPAEVLDEWMAQVAVTLAPEAPAPVAPVAEPISAEILSEWVADAPAVAPPPAAPAPVVHPEPAEVLSEWVAGSPALVAPVEAPVAEEPVAPVGPVAVDVEMEDWLRSFDALVSEPDAPVAVAPAPEAEPLDEAWLPVPEAAPVQFEVAVPFDVDEPGEPGVEVEYEIQAEAWTPVAAPEPAPVARRGRFSLGGWAAGEGEVAISGVAFDDPLDEAPAPGAVELAPDGVRNALVETLAVLDAPGFQPDEDGFALSVAAGGEGTFLVTGTYVVRAATDGPPAHR